MQIPVFIAVVLFNSGVLILSLVFIYVLYPIRRRKAVVFLLVTHVLNSIFQIILIAYAILVQITNDGDIVTYKNISAKSPLQIVVSFFSIFGLIMSNFVVGGLVYCNLEILDIFKVLTVSVTTQKILLAKKFLYVYVITLSFLQFVQFRLVDHILYVLAVVWLRIFFFLACIIYDNVQVLCY
jgi:hypothetical protein